MRVIPAKAATSQVFITQQFAGNAFTTLSWLTLVEQTIKIECYRINTVHY
jgi:hypothetical protein